MKTSRIPLVLVLSALGLSACGGGGNEQSASEEPLADETTQASIDYAIWNAEQQPPLQKVIDAFNGTYPNIDVQIQVTPYEQYFTKLQTQGSSQTLPDVFTMNSLNFETYAENGLLAPLTPLVEDGQLDPSNYPQALIDSYTFDDTLLGVPQNSQTIAMWYNEQLFAEAGVDTPTSDWTWDDLRTAARTISDELGDEGVFGIATDLTGQQAYYNTILQAGGYILSDDKETSGFDDPASIEGLQFWTDLIAEGASPSVRQLADTPAPQMFNSGRAAMMFNGAWSVAEVQDSPVADVADIAALPQGEERGVVVAGTAAVVSRASEELPAARAFQAFLGSQEGQEILAGEGLGNPAFLESQQVFVDSAPQYNIEAFTDASEYASPYPTSGDTTAWNLLETELLPSAFSGDRPVADVAGELASRMNDLLAAEAD
ncbi:extracellular solute-binding protein [Phycicoccus sp. BSK3Z-2]|uniref:Extracellular solute-binding protein n=1 Tax=Phycicoccus avicenniae TaxID=2828860 RepID=A0A941D4A2_9MICO|nr:sugar ABC transporter substrate-binding protein [Phycicoccus avicenniae]MBR7741834.1 extracellular solute-binding protein [Phycicoccus avicenniae]